MNNSIISKLVLAIAGILVVITLISGIGTILNREPDVAVVTQEGNKLNTPVVVNTTSASPTATPTVTPTPTPTVTRQAVICIDPRYQEKANSEQEPDGPGSTVTASKMKTVGTQDAQGRKGYDWNLTEAKKLKTELESRGYKVVLTRDTNKVDISNAERAQVANNAKADVFISIQLSSEDKSITGIKYYVPDSNNAYVGSLAAKCEELAKCLSDKIVATTDAKTRAKEIVAHYAVVNYSKMPVCVLALGNLNNTEEDTKLWTAEYQEKLAKGIADGIDAYFKANPIPQPTPEVQKAGATPQN